MNERAPGYEPRDFPPFAVTVDIVVLTILDGALHALVIERGVEPYRGAVALPGGFVRHTEALEAAAARELREETGVEASGYLEQLGAYGQPERDPRMRVVTVAFLSILAELPGVEAGSDARAATLRPVAQLLGRKARYPLAFDHEQILKDGVDRVREALETTSAATAFLGREFTLAELRAVYEAIWDVWLDPANFRRQVLAQGFVRPTGKLAPSGPDGGKPAERYRAGRPRTLRTPLTKPSKKPAR